MKIHRANLATCDHATGLVVVIDVLRAFTTAAFLFTKGVKEIILVSSVEEAVELHKKLPDTLLLGEINGIKITGFDLGNSPSEIMSKELTECRIIQRTTAGTQGVIRSTQSDLILVAALTNISATVRYIRQLSPSIITLVQTGFFPDEGGGMRTWRVPMPLRNCWPVIHQTGKSLRNVYGTLAQGCIMTVHGLIFLRGTWKWL
jgi:2-phosphosulfolactate phosphatase